ncbi:MAG: hypothetical protein IKE43_00520 [Coriobacteriales bacterium]|nr:hypothetical protein [Coriobacteriales bacterium]
MATMGSTEEVLSTARVPHFSGEEAVPPVTKPPVNCLLVIVGMAFLWPCLGTFVTSRFRHMLSLSDAALNFSVVGIVFGCLCLSVVAVCLLFRKRLEPLFAHGSTVVLAVGILGLAGHALIIWSQVLQILVTPLVVLGLALSALFVVVHTYAWGSSAYDFTPGQVITIYAASCALSFGLQLFIWLLPGELTVYFLLICPLGSGICWHLAYGRVFRQDLKDHPSLRISFRQLPWKFIVPALLLIYFELVFSNLLFLRYENWPNAHVWISLAICCLFWLICAVVVSKMHDRANIPTLIPILVWILAALLVLFMAALLLTVLFPAGTSLITERILVGTGSCLRFYIFIAIACAISERRASVLAGFSFFTVLVVCIPVMRLVTIAVSHVEDQTLIASLTAPQVVVPIAGIMLFAIAVGLVLASLREAQNLAKSNALQAEQAIQAAQAEKDQALLEREQLLSEIERAAQTTDAAGGQDTSKLQEIAATMGLSAREGEVLDLIVHGYSAKRIAQKLFVSESTVVTHTTHIYRKFGVSSKQELLEKIESTR